MIKKIFLLLFISSIYSIAQTHPNPEIHSLISTGISQIIVQQYGPAEQTFKQLEQKHPKQPYGKIYLGILEIVKAEDYGTQPNEAKIEDLLEEARVLTDDLLDKDDENIWNIYAAALCDGFAAYGSALSRNWVATFTSGYSALKNIEKCLAKNPSFTDGLIGRASFDYWKEKKAGWLPFGSGDEKEAIRTLEKSINGVGYNVFLGVNSLLWIYIDREEYQKAVALADRTLLKTPNSRYFLWVKARALEKYDYRSSISVYNQLLNSYINEGKLSNHNKVVILHKLAINHNNLGEKQKALSLCTEALSVKLTTSYEKDRLEKRIENITKLRDSLK